MYPACTALPPGLLIRTMTPAVFSSSKAARSPVTIVSALASESAAYSHPSRQPARYAYSVLRLTEDIGGHVENQQERQIAKEGKPEEYAPATRPPLLLQG